MAYRIVELEEIGCARGKLMAFENGVNLEFTPQRTYVIYGNNDNVRRGYHAHYDLKQLIVCVNGSCKFLIDDGKDKKIISLSKPQQGLVIEGLVWREIFDFSHDCILMVLADKIYDPDDYIRDYQFFLKTIESIT